MSATKFLSRYVNREPDIKELLIVIQAALKCEGVFLFISTDQHTYKPWKNTLRHAQFEPKTNDNFHISDDGKDCNGFQLSSGEPVKNLLIVPIRKGTVKIGSLCSYNKLGQFTEDDIAKVCSLLTLLQILMQKDIFLSKLKSTYSDENFMSKDLFLANMSHEIKTPLNGIVGYNQLLLQTSLNITQENYLQNMNTCSVQLMKIINDVLDFSKLNSKKMTLRNDCFQMDGLVETLKRTVMQEILERKQTLQFVVDRKTVPDYVIIDQQKLVQVLVNFITNASKYSASRTSIIVKIGANPSQNELVFDVKDQGIGISESEQCQLFNSFVQLNNSLVKKGSGLGLAISKRLIELLKGTYCVKSTLGVGSVFSFTCKYQTAETFENVIAQDIKLLHGKHVLLVDDVQVNRLQIAEILFEWKMHPIVCASALEALRMVMSDRYPFELALVDICMPAVSGVELARQIKEDKPLFPLIALSSSEEQVFTQDFDVYLTKPVNKIQLFNAIHSVVRNNTSHHAYIGAEKEQTICTPTSPCDEFEKSISILVAEDISYNQTVLVEMLRKLGYPQVTTAVNGKETIDLLESADFDILLLDLRMPVVDGFGVLEYLSTKVNTPDVIVVSASALGEDKIQCTRMNVHYYIAKPIQMLTLKEVLLKVVSARRNILY
jgi:signal transduction histidine kinase/DNA-binding response OmpR family regulator